jgi:hypothetical protein
VVAAGEGELSAWLVVCENGVASRSGEGVTQKAEESSRAKRSEW